MDVLARLKDDIHKIVDDYQENLGGPISKENTLTKFMRLNDAIKAGAYDVSPSALDSVDKAFDRMLTYDALDEYALKTIKTDGTSIIVIEHPADDPRDTGWVDIEGEITGTFNLPAGVVSILPDKHGDIYLVDIEDGTETIHTFIDEGPMREAIIGSCDIAVVDPEPYNIDIKVTGISKKGNVALVEFRVKVF